MSDVVAQACDSKLGIVPLERSDVRRWRENALGANPPHVPTLMQIDDLASDQARAWTGLGMLLPLSRRLGLRSGLRVLRALGVATREPDPGEFDKPTQEQRTAGLNRKRFLQLGAGAAVAATVLIAGRKPAAFATPAEREIKAWIARNRASLPTTYDGIIAHPMAYRHAIYAELPADVRSKLWVEQLARYRTTLAPLDQEQTRALDQASALFSRTDLFTGTGSGPSPAVHRDLEAMRGEAERAFGKDTAGRMLGTLAPPNERSTILPQSADWLCECSQYSSYCNPAAVCQGSHECTQSSSGCGTGFIYSCDGYCK